MLLATGLLSLLGPAIDFARLVIRARLALPRLNMLSGSMLHRLETRHMPAAQRLQLTRGGRSRFSESARSSHGRRRVQLLLEPATLRLVNRLRTNARIKTDQLDLVAFGIVEVQRAPLDPLVVLDFNRQPQTLQTRFF